MDSNNLNSEQLKSEKYHLKKTKAVRLQDNVLIDLEKSEEDLLNDIGRKVKYNIRYAAKNNVEIKFEDSDEAFNKFIKIFLETKSRHSYYGRNESYIRTVWKIFKESEETEVKIATAYVGDEIIVSWFLLGCEGVLYYPYGGSLLIHSKLKPTYLQAWEVIKWAKENNYKHFDWMGIETDKNGQVLDGFGSFKMQFGGRQVKYNDSYDLVINQAQYTILKLGEKLRNKFKIIKKVV
ncbi:MAG: peptidoglycan bridge formation glycyltransferase FemA/FemB family protein [Candidatus Dojkabacteria bacterium]|nr:peptidoglycan bridge formation glycyltransferase FemA/FemB family protein [Candidatus Dojkabacteria bacterium]